MKNKRGFLRGKSGEIVKKAVTASAITLFVIPSEAKSWHYIFGGNRNYVSRYSRPYYTPQAFGRRLPDGSIHSGYVPADTRYSMRAKSHEHSGLVSRGWYRLPSGLKDLIPPRDWGNRDVAKEYARRFFVVPQTSLVNKIDREEGASYKERLAASRALTQQRLRDAEQRRQQEGLDEPPLFRSWCETLGEPYSIAMGKIRNRTSWVQATLNNYNLVIAWQDPNWKHPSYDRRVDKLRKEGMTIHEVTETDQIQLTSKLERITIQYLRKPS